MFKSILKKEYISYVLVLCFGLFMSAMAVSASSTISTNISTGGTLSVTGLSSLGQATSTMLSAYTAYFGGTATSTFASDGSLTLVAGLSGTSGTFSGAVNTATASTTGLVKMNSFTVGTGSTVAGILFGTCTPTIGSVAASTTAAVICTGSEAATTAYKVFVTPNITNPSIIFSSASSTASGIQVSVYNTGWVNGTPGVAVDPADNAWSWMAIK